MSGPNHGSGGVDSDTVGPVVDRYPEGLPFLLSERLEATVREALDAGVPAGRVYERLADERVAQFREDPAYRERLRRYLSSAGVDGLCATAIAFGAESSQGRAAVHRSLARLQALVDAADWLETALGSEDFGGDGVALFLGLEDTVCLEGDLDALDPLYDLGVRAVQLAYDDRNRAGGGYAGDDAGLTAYGRDLLDRLNDLGVVVDLSHCGDRTTRDAVERSRAPPALSHVFCRSLRDDPRGTPDGTLRRVGARDGFVGVMAVPPFLGSEAGLDAVGRHVERASDLAGVDSVGVMTNWGVWTPETPAVLREALLEDSNSHLGEFRRPRGTGVPPMASYDEWGEIPAMLARRGYTADETRGLCGGNFVRYLDRVL
jgi:membrane dipeptidase